MHVDSWRFYRQHDASKFIALSQDFSPQSLHKFDDWFLFHCPA